MDNKKKRYGSWTLLSKDIPLRNHQQYWLCVCECGAKKTVLKKGWSPDQIFEQEVRGDR